MADEVTGEVARLELDGEWSLSEFSGFGRQYAQLYSFFYALDIVMDPEQDGRVQRAFAVFPWIGGWSAVDFFEQLRYIVPKEERLRVKEIAYASPGHIDLWAVAAATIPIAVIVSAITVSINRIHNTYRNIQKGIRDNKLGKIDVRRAQIELSIAEQKFVDDSVDRLSTQMGMSREDVEAIQTMTFHSLGTLKILLAVYRRAYVLAKLQAKGKIRVGAAKPVQPKRAGDR